MSKKTKTTMNYAIGIDLGTTNSCVALWRNNHVEIIPNDQGHRVTPSCVAFTPTQRLIGDAAFNQIAVNPANTIFDAKRLIGRTYQALEVQNDIKLWPFRVEEGGGGKPLIAVRYRGVEKKFAAEEISSMILGKMRDYAETFLGTTVENAVITVPAYFSDAQRLATKDAGTIAGLNVMRIINEPTAAAISYDLDRRESGEAGKQSVMIFDLGGGTLDVSVLEVEEGQLTVKATAGDTHLGGEDFDHRMVEFLADEVRCKHRIDVSGNPRALRRMRTACERAKRSLCYSVQATVDLNLHEGLDFRCSIMRAKFEALNEDLFQMCMTTVESCLRDVGMSPENNDQVVLVGGSTRIPRIRELLCQLFNGREPRSCINPEEAVACGAAIHAAMLNGSMLDLSLRDVTPLSLGVDTRRRHERRRPSQHPCAGGREKTYATVYDYQKSVSFEIFEGERPLTRDNNLLGGFQIAGILPAPARALQFTVRFSIDVEGILQVSAVENFTGSSAEIVITNYRARLSAEEIRRMVEEAGRFRAEDEEVRRRVLEKNSLENFVYSVRDAANQTMIAARMSESERSEVAGKVDECLRWLGDNELPELRECEEKRREIDRTWAPIITRILIG